jgi:hypothetical protein
VICVPKEGRENRRWRKKRERGTSETKRGLGGVIRSAAGTEGGSVRTSRSTRLMKKGRSGENGAILAADWLAKTDGS